MHAAFLVWWYSFGFWHVEAVTGPEAGFLGIGVGGRVQISAVVVRVEDVVGLAPIGGEGAYWVFYEIWRLCPFSQAQGGIEKIQCGDERSKAFVFEPACTAYGYVCTGRKGEEDSDGGVWWKPFADVGADADNVAGACFARRMLEVDAIAREAGRGPREDHSVGLVEEADDDSFVIGHRLPADSNRRERAGFVV